MVMAKLGASTIFGRTSCRRERTEGRDRSGVSLIWVVATLLMRLLPFRVVRALPSGGKAARAYGSLVDMVIKPANRGMEPSPPERGRFIFTGAYLASSMALTSSVTASSEVLI